MENFIIYIGKAAVGAGVFYLTFLMLFQNQKHFTFNRFYLPVSLMLSFIIPLFTFTTVKYIEANTSGNSFAYLANTTEQIQNNNFIPEWYHYLFGLYILGIAGFLFHLLLGHAKAIQLIRQSRKQNLFETPVNITPKDVHPFSFFSKIVLSERTLGSKNLEMIVSHENIHVEEKHTYDILFTEILFMLQWFNPFAWLIKDAVKNNLEYKTDHQIVQHFNPQNYQLAMVALADKEGVASFLIALNGSQLKNRIIMMKKKTESKYTFLKQLILLPLLAILVMGLSGKKEETRIIYPETSNSEISNQLSTLSSNKNFKSVELKEEHAEMESFGNNRKNKAILFNTEKESARSNSLMNLIINIDGKVISPDNTDLKKYDTTKEFDSGKIIDALQINRNKVQSNILKLNKKDATLYILTSDYVWGTNPEFDKIAEENKGNTTSDTKKSPSPSSESNAVVPRDTIKSKEEIKVTGYKQKHNGNSIIIKGSAGEKKPMYIVDGKEEDDIAYLNPESIESISVLKDETATTLYGENAKNGVVMINTKAAKSLSSGDKTVVVDGNKFDGNINDIPVEDVQSISVLKGETASPLIYGENAKNGVVIINTKTKYNSGTENENKPYIVVNGKEYNKPLSEIDTKIVKAINVLKEKEATEKYGEKAGNGAIEITTTNENTNTNPTITTPLDLRRFIAQNIKYPKVAQEQGQQGTVFLNVKINDKKWQVVQAEKSEKQRIDLDEVIVVGYGDSKKTKSEKENKYPYLVEEVRRVIQLSPEIDIPDFEGKTISIAVKFMLQ